MIGQPTNDTSSAQTEMVISLIVNAWAAQNKSVTTFFNKHSDDAYMGEIAPGRNRAVYLLGHLVSVNDGMLPLFGLGKRLFPELEEAFVKNADDPSIKFPSMIELRKYWETLNKTLADHFAAMTPQQWLSKHEAVSEEDFLLAPQRNKLNVLIGRTNHQSYHSGQFHLLNVKEIAV